MSWEWLELEQDQYDDPTVLCDLRNADPGWERVRRSGGGSVRALSARQFVRPEAEAHRQLEPRSIRGAAAPLQRPAPWLEKLTLSRLSPPNRQRSPGRGPGLLSPAATSSPRLGCRPPLPPPLARARALPAAVTLAAFPSSFLPVVFLLPEPRVSCSQLGKGRDAWPWGPASRALPSGRRRTGSPSRSGACREGQPPSSSWEASEGADAGVPGQGGVGRGG